MYRTESFNELEPDVATKFGGSPHSALSFSRMNSMGTSENIEQLENGSINHDSKTLSGDVDISKSLNRSSSSLCSPSNINYLKGINFD